MKPVYNALVLGMGLLLATGAVAAEKSSLTLHDPVSVAGKQLKPGDYTLQWEGGGPNVELNILKGNSVVATTPARLVELSKPSAGTGMTTRTHEDGSRSLSEIHLRGKRFSLEIGGPQTAAAHDTK